MRSRLHTEVATSLFIIVMKLIKNSLDQKNLLTDLLFSNRDPAYQQFQAALIPTIPPDMVIGVRTPIIRKIAKEATNSAAESFMKQLPHHFYEENNLHGYLIERIHDYRRCLCELVRFLPYVNNWATCDSVSPPIFKRYLAELSEIIYEWIHAEHPYTVRYGIGMLLKYYLGEQFHPKYLKWVAEIHSEEYYVRMMQAWYFATALAKQYDDVIPYLQENRLTPWIHNKTIQKALESNRIFKDRKQYLRTLKRKSNE